MPLSNLIDTITFTWEILTWMLCNNCASQSVCFWTQDIGLATQECRGETMKPG